MLRHNGLPMRLSPPWILAADCSGTVEEAGAAPIHSRARPGTVPRARRATRLQVFSRSDAAVGIAPERRARQHGRACTSTLRTPVRSRTSSAGPQRLARAASATRAHWTRARADDGRPARARALDRVDRRPVRCCAAAIVRRREIASVEKAASERRSGKAGEDAHRERHRRALAPAHGARDMRDAAGLRVRQLCRSHCARPCGPRASMMQELVEQSTFVIACMRCAGTRSVLSY